MATSISDPVRAVVETGARPSPLRRWVPALALAGLVVHVPHLLPLAGEHLRGDSSCRDTWIELFPVLPGLLGSVWLCFLVDVTTPGPRQVVAAVLTLAVLAVLVFVLSRGWRARLIGGLAAASFFLFNAWALDQAFAI